MNQNASDIYPGPLGGGIAHYARFEEIYEGRLFKPRDTAASGPTGMRQTTNWSMIYQFMFAFACLLFWQSSFRPRVVVLVVVLVAVAVAVTVAVLLLSLLLLLLPVIRCAAAGTVCCC